MLFDSHAHYDDAKFDSDRDEILKGLHQKNGTNPLGVSYVLNAASDLESAEASLELARRYPFVFAAAGIHPHAAGAAPEKFEEDLICLLRQEKAVAVGEIGLDYHYDFSPREKQREVFERQLRLAGQCRLPVIVHDRQAHGDCMEYVRKYREVTGVFHSFSGSFEMASELVALGWYISYSGSLTFQNARNLWESVGAVPPERLLIETDSPYLTPVPFRGQRNQSSYVYFVARKIAELKGMPVEEIAAVTCQNAKRLFGIL